MESNIIAFIILLGLFVAFVVNTVDKFGWLIKAQIYHGSKWFLPEWLPLDCMYCATFWLSIFFGVIACISFQLDWFYYFFPLLSHQITIKLVRG